MTEINISGNGWVFKIELSDDVTKEVKKELYKLAEMALKINNDKELDNKK